MVYRYDGTDGLSTPPPPGTQGAEVFPTAGIPPGVPASVIDVYWIYSICEELRNVVIGAGITPAKAQVNQLLQALQSGALTFCVDTGAAGAYAVSPIKPMAALGKGMRIAFFAAAGPNTGPCTLNYGGLGAIPFVSRLGNAFTGYEIVAGQLVEAVYNGTAWQALNTAAPDSGNANKTFSVANASSANQAVALGQVFQEFNYGSSTTVSLGKAQTTYIFTDAATGPITITVGPGAFAGQRVIIYGRTNYAITVASTVSSGSPYFYLPDGSSVYSIALPTGIVSRLELVFDGNNWRGSTEGRKVVSNAYSSNQAVALGQFPIPVQTASGQGTSIGANFNGTISVSFTAPCDGTVVAFGKVNTDTTAASPITGNLLINGNVKSTDSTLASQSHLAVLPVTNGTSVTAAFNLTSGSTSPAITATTEVMALFIPSP
ncbi:hypothetical protein [Acidocella sp.]|uniref:hypothetical protein n=1 Tax=Acidocella sp. TaxID=50710 RepID=UPI0026252EF2|nr:hypothetical protein [Acidocella sp.]